MSKQPIVLTVAIPASWSGIIRITRNPEKFLYSADDVTQKFTLSTSGTDGGGRVHRSRPVDVVAISSIRGELATIGFVPSAAPPEPAKPTNENGEPNAP